MQDFLHSTGGQRPTNRADIYFKDLGSSAPVLVQLINNAICRNNDKLIRHIGGTTIWYAVPAPRYVHPQWAHLLFPP